MKTGENENKQRKMKRFISICITDHTHLWLHPIHNRLGWLEIISRGFIWDKLSRFIILTWMGFFLPQLLLFISYFFCSVVCNLFTFLWFLCTFLRSLTSVIFTLVTWIERKSRMLTTTTTTRSSGWNAPNNKSCDSWIIVVIWNT